MHGCIKADMGDALTSADPEVGWPWEMDGIGFIGPNPEANT
jgi:hypothetical protein